MGPSLCTAGPACDQARAPGLMVPGLDFRGRDFQAGHLWQAAQILECVCSAWWATSVASGSLCVQRTMAMGSRLISCMNAWGAHFFPGCLLVWATALASEEPA